MNYFDPIHAENQYKNELMHHARRQTELLEQIAQLLKQQGHELPEAVGQTKRPYTRRK